MKKDIHTKNPLAALAISPSKTFMEVQERDEAIELLVRSHIVTNLSWIIFSVFGFVLPLFVFSEFARDMLEVEIVLDVFSRQARIVLVLFWYIGVLMYMLQSATMWFFNVLIVTNERLVDLDVTWPFHRFVSEAHISQIQDVSFRQGGLFASLFNYGNIYVQTAGVEQNIELTKAPNPALIHDVITDIVEQYRRKHPAGTSP